MEPSTTTAPVTPPLRSLKSLPGPRSLPLLGNALDVRPETIHLSLEAWARRYGPVFRFNLGPSPTLVISNPEAIRKMLVDRPSTFRRIRNIETVMGGMHILGVFAAEGEMWRRQRKLLNPGFQTSHLETFYPSLALVTQRLHDVLGSAAQDGSSVEVLSVLMRYTVDVTSIVGFGKDLDTLRRGPDALQRHIELIFPALQQRVVAPFPYWKLLPSARRVDQALAATRKVLQEIIEAARRTLELEPERAEKPRTLLDAMLAARDDEGGAKLTDEEVFSNVMTLLLAGEDTTANTIAWMMHYLAVMPAVQRRAREEVDAVQGAEAIPTMAHLKQLHYVAGIAQEALRLRSPVPLMYLEANEDTVVEGVAVPKGSGVMALTRLPCLDNAYFGDAQNFRPERWLPEPPPDTLPHSPRLMMPFGAGARVCPGRSLALIECALVAGMVLRHFEVEAVDPNAEVREVNAFTVQPVGVRLRFRRRAAA
jgi:cytochrome P450